MQVGTIALIIVFQPELRSALERMGRSNISKFFKFDEHESESTEYVIDQICKAAGELSAHKTGALVVIERTTKIGGIIDTGVTIDSRVNAELILNLFVPNTPLHDGAVIIRGSRIAAAACFLPLTQNTDLNTELGSRHRAALGMTEESDALVVIVSEETGKISLALEGSLTRNLSVDSLCKALTKFMITAENEKAHKLQIPWKRA
jgi:diadenylate cyclase